MVAMGMPTIRTATAAFDKQLKVSELLNLNLQHEHDQMANTQTTWQDAPLSHTGSIVAVWLLVTRLTGECGFFRLAISVAASAHCGHGLSQITYKDMRPCVLKRRRI